MYVPICMRDLQINKGRIYPKSNFTYFEQLFKNNYVLSKESAFKYIF